MEQKQAVIFELDNCLYGVDIMRVNEIIRMVQVTPVPEADHFIEGIINLRGQVIPVVNLCRKLGLNYRDYHKDNRIIVIQSDNSKFGMIVDRVLEVSSYSDVDITPVNNVNIDTGVIDEIIRIENNLCIVLKLNNLYQ
ncbi:chemotaxis protein CheW [Desulfoscipio sp. XC116]|uniref:chemotaxis protein CheW n=1 Tax=Desulfoscipio sp. XC116 TaxID=3144975 RepID=UPI00325A45C0